MVLHHLLLDGVLQILQTGVHLLEVDVAETAVEQDLARVQLEQQAQLRVVDQCVAAEVEEGVVEVGEGLFEVAEQEVGDTLLEVGDGEVLVELDCALVALDLRGEMLGHVLPWRVEGRSTKRERESLPLARAGQGSH